MKTFIMADIHGAYKALVQCLERSNFNKESDTLIMLGDVVDGYPEIKESIEELLTIKNLIFVKGNHDKWFQQWAISGSAPDIWVSQGGRNTIRSYGDYKSVPESHLNLIKNAPYFYVDDKNRLFVHGGIGEGKTAEESLGDNRPDGAMLLMWDRYLYQNSKIAAIKKENKKFTVYDEVFLGHTQTENAVPEHHCNVWNLDTGAGWNGKLTIMNVDSKEWWQSDFTFELYSLEEGRAGQY